MNTVQMMISDMLPFANVKICYLSSDFIKLLFVLSKKINTLFFILFFMFKKR